MAPLCYALLHCCIAPNFLPYVHGSSEVPVTRVVEGALFECEVVNLRFNSGEWSIEAWTLLRRHTVETAKVCLGASKACININIYIYIYVTYTSLNEIQSSTWPSAFSQPRAPMQACWEAELRRPSTCAMRHCLWGSHRNFERTCVVGLVKSTPTNLYPEIIGGRARSPVFHDSNRVKPHNELSPRRHHQAGRWLFHSVSAIPAACSRNASWHCTRKRSQWFERRFCRDSGIPEWLKPISVYKLVGSTYLEAWPTQIGPELP